MEGHAYGIVMVGKTLDINTKIWLKGVGPGTMGRPYDELLMMECLTECLWGIMVDLHYDGE